MSHNACATYEATTGETGNWRRSREPHSGPHVTKCLSLGAEFLAWVATPCIKDMVKAASQKDARETESHRESPGHWELRQKLTKVGVLGSASCNPASEPTLVGWLFQQGPKGLKGHLSLRGPQGQKTATIRD